MSGGGGVVAMLGNVIPSSIAPTSFPLVDWAGNLLFVWLLGLSLGWLVGIFWLRVCF